MSTFKNLIVNLFTTLILAIVSVFGMLAGYTIWNNGLGDKVAAKIRKLFNK